MGFVNYVLAWLTVTRDFKSDGSTSFTTGSNQRPSKP